MQSPSPGRVEQHNFNDYRMLRFNESPVIDIHLVKSTAASGGVGEPGTSAVMPAVANAIFAGDGQARPQAAGEGPTAFDLDDAAASDMLDRRVA